MLESSVPTDSTSVRITPLLRVQHDHPKPLLAVRRVVRHQIRGELPRRPEPRTLAHLARQHPPSELDGGKQSSPRAARRRPTRAAVRPMPIRASPRTPPARSSTSCATISALRDRTPVPSSSATSSLSPSDAHTRARQLLARPILRRQRLHSASSSAGSTSPAGPRSTACASAVSGVSSMFTSTMRAARRRARCGSAATG